MCCGYKYLCKPYDTTVIMTLFYSLSLRDRVIEDDEHSDVSYYLSMAPDSLEVPLN